MAYPVPKLPSQLEIADALADTDLAIVQQGESGAPVKKVLLGTLKAFVGTSAISVLAEDATTVTLSIGASIGVVEDDTTATLTI